MRIEITKAKEANDLVSIRDAHFTTPGTVLVYDNDVTPVIDTITPYTDALAAHATLISPIKQYPGSNK